MDTAAANRTYFQNHVRDYADAEYWRSDEEGITQRFFTDSNAELLVLGCGAGRVLPRVLERGFKLTAVDIEEDMVEAARSRMRGAPIEFSAQDAAHLSFADRSFKYIFFPFHGIDYVQPDIYAGVAEAARVMTDDGTFIFSSHNRLFLKKLHRYFVGSKDTYEGLHTYRTSPFDALRLKKYFKSVKVIQRISLLPAEKANIKDWCYKLLPWLNKSTYFVCSEPKRA